MPSEDNCDRPAVVESIIIDVAPAPEPVIEVPAIADLTCAEAASFVAPAATFSNGETGACEISGTVEGVVESNFTQCGGTITITYTVDPVDNCDRPAIVDQITIDVAPAPDPVIAVPELSDLSCGGADGFVAPDATFSNGETGVCEISGVVTPTIENNFDECGGTITICLLYTSPSPRDRTRSRMPSSA